jgi:hypothetical protein
LQNVKPLLSDVNIFLKFFKKNLDNFRLLQRFQSTVSWRSEAGIRDYLLGNFPRMSASALSKVLNLTVQVHF